MNLLKAILSLFYKIFGIKKKDINNNITNNKANNNCLFHNNTATDNDYASGNDKYNNEIIPNNNKPTSSGDDSTDGSDDSTDGSDDSTDGSDDSTDGGDSGNSCDIIILDGNADDNDDNAPSFVHTPSSTTNKEDSTEDNSTCQKSETEKLRLKNEENNFRIQEIILELKLINKDIKINAKEKEKKEKALLAEQKKLQAEIEKHNLKIQELEYLNKNNEIEMHPNKENEEHLQFEKEFQAEHLILEETCFSELTPIHDSLLDDFCDDFSLDSTHYNERSL